MFDAWFLDYDEYNTRLYIGELGAFLTDKIIEPPEVKTYMVDVPGRNGILDLTDALTGAPVYGNRKITMEFRSKSSAATWPELFSELLDAVHGKRMRLQFSDDPDYAYEGRFYVEPITALGKDFCGIKITGDCDPYKQRMTLNEITSFSRIAITDVISSEVMNDGNTYKYYSIKTPELSKIRVNTKGKIYAKCEVSGFEHFTYSKDSGRVVIQEVISTGEYNDFGLIEVAGDEHIFSYKASRPGWYSEKQYASSDFLLEEGSYWINLPSFEVYRFSETVGQKLPSKITVKWTFYNKGAIL